MAEKYSCPKCGKELSEADVVRGVCSNCHSVFDSLPQKKEEQKEPEWLKEKRGSEETESQLRIVSPFVNFLKATTEVILFLLAGSFLVAGIWAAFLSHGRLVLGISLFLLDVGLWVAFIKVVNLPFVTEGLEESQKVLPPPFGRSSVLGIAAVVFIIFFLLFDIFAVLSQGGEEELELTLARLSENTVGYST